MNGNFLHCDEIRSNAEVYVSRPYADRSSYSLILRLRYFSSRSIRTPVSKESLDQNCTLILGQVCNLPGLIHFAYIGAAPPKLVTPRGATPIQAK